MSKLVFYSKIFFIPLDKSAITHFFLLVQQPKIERGEKKNYMLWIFTKQPFLLACMFKQSVLHCAVTHLDAVTTV